MTRHILRKRLALNWKWGPLNSYRINLDEIDSAGAKVELHGNALVELVADFKAGLQTQRMLLDDFMQGFLFTLFQQKWERYTHYVFYTLRLAELAYLVLIVVQSLMLKREPSNRSVTASNGQ